MTMRPHPPLGAGAPVRSLEDVRQLEATLLADALPARSTYELIGNASLAYPQRTALTLLLDADPATPPIRWTYAELFGRMHQTANALHSVGVGAQDAIAVLLPTCLEYHLAHWGGQAAGIVLPLNPLLSEDKLVALMCAAGAKVLIAYGDDFDAGYWSKTLRIRSRVPSLTHVVRVAPRGGAGRDRPVLAADVLDFETILSEQPADRLISKREIATSDIAAYFHTGGTTGAPKLAMHTHANQVFSAWATCMTQGFTSTDVVMSSSPLFHVAAALVGALPTLSVGAETIIPTMRLMRNPEVVRNYWKLVQAFRATVLTLVPTVLTALSEVSLDGADLSSVRYCRTGASPLPQELATRFLQLFGLRVSETLGMTEMAGLSCVTPPGAEVPAGCVGYPLPHVRCRIVVIDPEGGYTDRDVKSGESGMLLFKGPNVFPGYVDPAETECSFTQDGWLITGDIGWRDDLGRIHVSGRAKDLIIRSGHNIDPRAIEEALATHPAVRYCAAVGAPDAYAGEIPVAFVTLWPGQDVTATELCAYAADHVDEAPARPKSVTILDAMPLTSVSKIFKPDLRAMATRAVIEATALQCASDIGGGVTPSLKIDHLPSGSWLVRVDAAPAAFQQAFSVALSRLPLRIELSVD